MCFVLRIIQKNAPNFFKKKTLTFNLHFHLTFNLDDLTIYIILIWMI